MLFVLIVPPNTILWFRSIISHCPNRVEIELTEGCLVGEVLLRNRFCLVGPILTCRFEIIKVFRIETTTVITDGRIAVAYIATIDRMMTFPEI